LTAKNGSETQTHPERRIDGAGKCERRQNYQRGKKSKAWTKVMFRSRQNLGRRPSPEVVMVRSLVELIEDVDNAVLVNNRKEDHDEVCGGKYYH